MNFFKARIKSGPYGPLHFVYYAHYYALRVPKFHFTKLFHRLPMARASHLRTFKSSDTVFILGSGSSINRISSSRWAHIASHDSFGFNFWICHPHLPTLYAFETMDPSITYGPVSVLDKFLELVADRATDYASVYKLVTDVRPDRSAILRRLPLAFRENLFTMRTVPAVARDREELYRSIRRLRSWGVFSSRNLAVQFKYCGTVSFLVSLAVGLGYRRIVLCGIDLSDADYFYSDARLYPEMSQFRSSPPGPVHLTAQRGLLKLPIDQVLYALRDLVLAPADIELFVESSDSKLFPTLPVYPDPPPTGVVVARNSSQQGP